MSDRRDPHARLLAAALNDGWDAGPAAAAARLAAARARRRRLLRRGTATAIAAGLVIMAALLLPSRTIVPGRTTAAPATRGYEIISDDQLLAELKDRALLVTRRDDGRREIVLLDE